MGDLLQRVGQRLPDAPRVLVAEKLREMAEVEAIEHVPGRGAEVEVAGTAIELGEDVPGLRDRVAGVRPERPREEGRHPRIMRAGQRNGPECPRPETAERLGPPSRPVDGG